MEDIKVGDYIRTKNGYILKVEEKTIIFNYGYIIFPSLLPVRPLLSK